MTREPSISALSEGLRTGDIPALSRAITLIESTNKADQQQARKLLEQILPNTGNAIRIGITGPPGVGKSTFIDTFGSHLTSHGKKIAVLTVDPTSQLSRGSILGDKTRMEKLARDPLAYIRPSSAGSAQGGVSGTTREAALLCEAAGFEIILIETVGVGQSEDEVREMVDVFLLLTIAGAGDELQGMKRGIMEIADMVIITKADGDNKKNALHTASMYTNALHLLPPTGWGWSPVAVTCSALTGEGISDIWNLVERYVTQARTSGAFDQNRERQTISWFHTLFTRMLNNTITEHKDLSAQKQRLENLVVRHELTPREAASELYAHLIRFMQQGETFTPENP